MMVVIIAYVGEFCLGFEVEKPGFFGVFGL